MKTLASFWGKNKLNKLIVIIAVLFIISYIFHLGGNTTGTTSQITVSPATKLEKDLNSQIAGAEKRIADRKNPLSGETTESPTPTPVPLTLEQKVKGVIPDSMSEVDITIEKAMDFNTFEDIPGKIDVTITANHTGSYWGTNSIKKATWKEAAGIIQKVFPLDKTINGVVILNNIPTTDTYGKKTKSMITTIDIYRTTFLKIDFNNFDYNNIPTIADQYIENKSIK